MYMRKTKKKRSVRKVFRNRRTFKKRLMRGGNKTYTNKHHYIDTKTSSN
mgnify:CR=1 FL=1